MLIGYGDDLMDLYSFPSQLDYEVTRSPSEETKAKLEELTVENRQLRSSFTDAQTNLAIVRSELATLRQQFDEKCDELEWWACYSSTLHLSQLFLD